MFIIPNQKTKKMDKVLLLSKLYLNCIDNIKLPDDYKHFESEITRYRLQFTEHYIDYIVFPSYLQFLYFIVLVKLYLFDFFILVRLFERKINIRLYVKEKGLVLYDSKKRASLKRRLQKI
jgi:hypothetical protein